MAYNCVGDIGCGTRNCLEWGPRSGSPWGITDKKSSLDVNVLKPEV